MSESPEGSAFVPHVNTEFRFVGSGNREETLLLVDVSSGPPHPAVEQYSLLFRASEATALGREIHAVEHAQLGRMSLYVERVIHSDPTHAYYEAVLSRFKDGSRGPA